MSGFSIPAINRAGYPVIAVCVVIGLAVSLFLHSAAFDILALLINIGVCYFFRDPDRIVPSDENIIVSPADGVVTFVKSGVAPPDELGMKNLSMTHVSIYMNMMNVHVNRMPFNATVKNMVYTTGVFKNLHFDTHDDDGHSYERQAIAIQDAQKNDFALIQIAGYVARRIVSNVSSGDSVKKGTRFGIICFGSRVDLYLPSNISVKVKKGQTMVAGETVLALYEDRSKDDNRNEGCEVI